MACFNYIQQQINYITFNWCFYISVKWLGCGRENYYIVLVVIARQQEGSFRMDLWETIWGCSKLAPDCAKWYPLALAILDLGISTIVFICFNKHLNNPNGQKISFLNLIQWRWKGGRICQNNMLHTYFSLFMTLCFIVRYVPYLRVLSDINRKVTLWTSANKSPKLGMTTSRSALDRLFGVTYTVHVQSKNASCFKGISVTESSTFSIFQNMLE